MTDIDPQEKLARFILVGRHVRPDGLVRPEAFMPHPHRDLSVTRHAGLSATELWELGKAVADLRNQKEARTIQLLGRSDLTCSDCLRVDLQVLSDEPPRNHANIKNWPADKSDQKIIALELAKSATMLIPADS